jgi:hypothetical protein
MELHLGYQDRKNQTSQNWIYFYEFMGSVFLIFAYNMNSVVDENAPNKE